MMKAKIKGTLTAAPQDRTQENGTAYTFATVRTVDERKVTHLCNIRARSTATRQTLSAMQRGDLVEVVGLFAVGARVTDKGKAAPLLAIEADSLTDVKEATRHLLDTPKAPAKAKPAPAPTAPRKTTTKTTSGPVTTIGSGHQEAIAATDWGAVADDLPWETETGEADHA